VKRRKIKFYFIIYRYIKLIFIKTYWFTSFISWTYLINNLQTSLFVYLKCKCSLLAPLGLAGLAIITFTLCVENKNRQKIYCRFIKLSSKVFYAYIYIHRSPNLQNLKISKLKISEIYAYKIFAWVNLIMSAKLELIIQCVCIQCVCIQCVFDLNIYARLLF